MPPLILVWTGGSVGLWVSLSTVVTDGCAPLMGLLACPPSQVPQCLLALISPRTRLGKAGEWPFLIRELLDAWPCALTSYS